MSLLAALVHGGPVRAESWNEPDPRWTPVGGMAGMGYPTGTGVTVTPDLAFQVSCVFQGVRLIAEPMGRFKPILYRRLEDDRGKARAREHPLWPRLAKSANAWQSAAHFRVVMTARAVLWGDAVAEQGPPSAGRAGELRPIDPPHVTVEQLESTRLRYKVRNDRGQERVLVPEQVFHLPGFGVHRFMGAELLWYARQAVALWLAQERFNAMYFRQGARPSLWMKVPGQLSPEAYARVQNQVSERLQGVDNMHRVLIGEQGAEFKEFGFTARESQMTEAREAQVHDIARWLNIPVHLLRATQQPTFASAEMFNREYYDITLAPWFDTWEQEIGRQLLGEDDDEHFVEFLLDALLRANTAERAQAQRLYVDGGIFSVNEVRLQENKNALAGEEYEKPHRAENIGGGGEPAVTTKRGERTRPARPARRPQEDDEDAPDRRRDRARLRLMAQAAATRLVRNELGTVRAHATKLASKPEAWADWLATFYGEFGGVVADALQVPPGAARQYVETHRAALAAGGIAAAADWETTAPPALVALALEEDPA